MRLRTDDTIACPTFGVKLHLDVYAAHTYGREPDNFALKEGQSGRVIFLSAGRGREIWFPGVNHVGSL